MKYACIDRRRKDYPVRLMCRLLGVPRRLRDQEGHLLEVHRLAGVARMGATFDYVIDCSMSNTGNCYDNAVVESFFGILKRERVIRLRYRNREQARADLFEYIEVFYNRKRRHGYLGNISPADFERQSNGSF